jgi:50S ribosomal protein L16 3-hydroxylase
MFSETFLNKNQQRTFLKNFWQRKPLKFDHCFADITGLLTPDDLAGLACEHHIESRIVKSSLNFKHWHLTQGPFDESLFSELPRSHWTLLVQDVDKWIPEVADLFDHFSFLPSWRLDDIMISYAAKGGSVGPHVDQYDVFLIQAAGSRRWKIGTKAVVNEVLIPNQPLRLMRDFRADKDFVLGPGEVLYLPPGIPHFGISLDDDCMTYSVGFRAPSMKDLLLEYFAESQTAMASTRFCDPGIKLRSTPGLFDVQLRKATVDLLKSTKISNQDLQRWLGQTLSRPKYDEFFTRQKLRTKGLLRRHEMTRMLYAEGAAHMDVFICGEHQLVPNTQKDFIRRLANNRVNEFDSLNRSELKYLEPWLSRGWFYWISSRS